MNGFTPITPFDQPLPPKPVNRPPNTGRYKGKRKKSNDRKFNDRNPDKHGGDFMWRCLRARNVSVYYNKPGLASHKCTNVKDGWTRKDMEAAHVEATLLAKHEMIDLRKFGLLQDENDLTLSQEERLDIQRGNEAIEGLLALGKNLSVSDDIRMKALSKVADILKPKMINPKALKATLQVDTGLQWLDAIGAPNPSLTTISSITSVTRDDPDA